MYAEATTMSNRALTKQSGITEEIQDNEILRVGEGIESIIPAIGTSQAAPYGATFTNPTAAVLGAQQYSPLLEFSGQGFGTTSMATETEKFGIQLRPHQETVAVPELVFYAFNASAGYTEQLAIRSFPQLNGLDRPLIAMQGTAAYINHPSSLTLMVGLTEAQSFAGAYIEIGGSSSIFGVNNVDYYTASATEFAPTTGRNLQQLCGNAANKLWKEVNSRQYGGVFTDVTFSATPDFDVSTSGEYQSMTLTGNVTSFTVDAGRDAELLTLRFIQSAGGGWSISGKPANVLFSGGTFALTAANGSIDQITLRYETSTGKWYEVARALNLS